MKPAITGVSWFPESFLGGWQGLDGNTACYVFLDREGGCTLLVCSHDPEYGRYGFTPYRLEADDAGCYILDGGRRRGLTRGGNPPVMHVDGWGSYMEV